MRIFAAERAAGLADALANPGKLAFASVATPSTTPTPLTDRLKELAAARTGKAVASLEDFDLYPLNNVLVSTGWNLNDAVFDPAEAWAARHTPDHKPFNHEHTESDVIGHQLSSWVVGEDGKEIGDDTPVDDLPAAFHIHEASVLYRHWSDEKLQERMDQIVAEIPQGKWFVSMECLFRDFDYALLETDGTQKVVARNKATAFLTKHLRFYGGQGTYNGARLGMVMRAYTFSGKGLVRTPANPASVIYPFSATAAQFYTSAEASGYHPVSTTPTRDSEVEEKLKQAETELGTTKAALAAAEKAKVDAETAKAAADAAKAESDKKVADLTAEVATAKDATKAADEKVAKVEKDWEATKAELATATKSLTETKAELTKTARTQAAVKAGLDEKAAETMVASSAGQTDEQFTASLEVVKALAAKAAKTPLTDALPEAAAASTQTTAPAPTPTGPTASQGLAALIRKTSSKRPAPQETK